MMNKIIIFKLGEQSGQNETNVSFCLFFQHRENLLNQGLEFGTVLAI